LTSALVGGEWPASRPDSFTPRKEPQTRTGQETARFSLRSGDEERLALLVVQPVVSPMRGVAFYPQAHLLVATLEAL
jgi:hypothetical protein